MRAEQQVGPVADRLADPAAEVLATAQHRQRQLMAGVGGVGAGRVELDRGEPLLDVPRRAFRGEIDVVVVVLALVVPRVEVGVGPQPLVHQAAHQLVDRLAGRLADDVPAGHLEPAEHAHHGEVGALGEAAGIALAPEPLDMVRVVPLQVALEHVVDDRHHGLGMEGRGIDLAHAFDPAIGLQGDEDPVHAADVRRWDRHDVRAHRDDLHGAGTLFLVIGPSLRAATTPRKLGTAWECGQVPRRVADHLPHRPAPAALAASAALA